MKVSEGGASFSYPESFCVVAEVKDVRTNRVRVTGDCDEAGDIWQSSFFLDLIDYNKIAIDGVQHYLSEAGAADTDFGPEWAQFAAQPAEQLCWFVTTRDTRNYWWEDESEELADLIPTSVIPEMVAQHYGRFLPQDKAAIAAQVLNRVWDAA